MLEKLKFNVSSHYMSSKNSKESGGYLSSTTYGGVKSSLTHMYRMSDKAMVRGFKKLISQLMLGIKRVVADNRRYSGASLDEGKREMSFEV